MKISIITVCFNEKDTIQDTIESILNQTLKNIEFIVIDGGSTDGTLDIIEKFKDKIDYFVSEPDNGIYHAMNKGIARSTGDFVIFLNANDVFYNNSVLEKVEKALIEAPDAKFLFGDVEYISEDKKSAKTQRFNRIKDDFSLIFSNICHQCIFYHRSLFSEIGNFSEDYKIYADWEFNIKSLVEAKVQALYLPIVISKFQLGGVCSSKALETTCKKEKKALVLNYYPEISFLVFINDFLKSKFGIFYKILIKIFLIKDFLKLFAGRKKHRLNIKAASTI